MRSRFPLQTLFLLILLATSAVAQSPGGTISGLVLDPSGRAIDRAEVLIVNDATGVRYQGETNNGGIYAVPNLPPGPYRIQVSKIGFKTLIKPDVALSVQDALAINFTLPIGAVSETVTVEGGAPLLDTESAAVSTVIDRQFAENLPLNGRSFQSLIQLTPGVVLTTSNHADNGQFSVDGQRASSNYWMVDGVSANIGIGVSPTGAAGNGLGGSVGSYSALGGTNSLVSVDAMQEFRIQTSTYAPEFGRTPGGQISIVTRSGTNDFHGTLFDYIRNDLFDANNWFNGYKNEPPLPKAKERQNDFGGTFAGPILRDRTFFFFSYEGLRLRLPQTSLSAVPDVLARQDASISMQPFLKVYPLPNGPEILDNAGNPTSSGQFNASYSNAASLDAYSLRIDHKLGHSLSLFGRYNYSPSNLSQRGGIGQGGGSLALNVVEPVHINTSTATVGATWNISPVANNDFRFNYSRADASTFYNIDDFGGGVPLDSLPFPAGFTNANAQFLFDILPMLMGEYISGKGGRNQQSQFNIVDSLSVQKGSHSLRFGVDFRQLAPAYGLFAYQQEAFWGDVPSAQVGDLLASGVGSSRRPTFEFHNLGIFAQDTWHLLPRLTLTYGLRWDIDFAPSANPNFLAVENFDLNDLSRLTLAPAGRAPFGTGYGNIAPRFGLAYQISQSENWERVLRGGVGVFYDLATSEVGNNVYGLAYPFGSQVVNFGGSFPLTPDMTAPPPIDIKSLSNPVTGELFAFDPSLKLPHALEWNVSLEQALQAQQSISASYIGSAGKRLIQSAYIPSPLNANFATAQLVTNVGTSEYHALQLQFRRRLTNGLQATLGYSWSHSIDTGSAGSTAVVANALVPGLDPKANRASSDFDIRHALSGGITYAIPAGETDNVRGRLLRGWSVQSLFQARSGPPVEVSDANLFQLHGAYTSVRPDVVVGQPLYLSGSQFPGGKAFNPDAFQDPPVDPSTGTPLRQGDLARNALRGFGAFQWDCAIHREFVISARVRLQFRAEAFNVLNHPNFGPPSGSFGQGGFGLSTELLGQSLAGNGSSGVGGFNPMYQIGGPRSMQFALKAMF